MAALPTVQRGRLLLAAMQLSLVALVLACSSVKPSACYQADNTASASSRQLPFMRPSSNSALMISARAGQLQVPGQGRDLLQERVVPKTKVGTQAAPAAATRSPPVPSTIPQPPALNLSEDLQRLKAQSLHPDLNKQRKLEIDASAQLALHESPYWLNITPSDKSDPSKSKDWNDTMASLDRISADITRDLAKQQSSGTPGFRGSTTVAWQAAGLIVFFLLIAV